MSDIDIADATATGGEEDPSPVLDVEEGADAAAAAATKSSVTFEAEAGDEEEEGDNTKSGNEDEDANRKKFVTWESRGASYVISNDPMRHCVWILLVLRAVQMGINFGNLFINPGFLTGIYNPEWGPGFSSTKANAFIASTQGLNNSLPFIIALVADFFLGDYWVILLLLIVFFLPGSLIVTLCAWPYQLGDTFPLHLYRIGYQILLTIGNGGIDAIVDIFGAKQFHPILHTDQLDSYFVWATVSAGAGGITATLVYAMIANVNVTANYGLMTIALFVSTVLFILGTKRYIVRKNDRKDNVLTAWAMLSAAFCWKKTEQGQVVVCSPGFTKVKQSRGGGVRDDLVTCARRLALVVPVQGLFVIGNTAPFQMTNILIPMSYSMSHPKLWSGANMVFSQSIWVVLFGSLQNRWFFPYLEKKNIRLSTSHRVSIGSCFYVLMYLAILGVDRRMRRVYAESGEMISIGWQAFPYGIGGLAYTFLMPPQDAITYRVSPSEWKVLGNAINKFMQQGLSAFISAGLYNGTKAWFTPSNGADNINGIENYTSATTWKFMWICLGFAAFQAIFSALPWVNRWYIKIEKYVEDRTAE